MVLLFQWQLLSRYIPKDPNFGRSLKHLPTMRFVKAFDKILLKSAAAIANCAWYYKLQQHSAK